MLARALRHAANGSRPGDVGRDTRLVQALWAGVAGAARGVRVALTALFHQVTGFFFAVFAVIGGFAAWREYRHYTAGQFGPGRALLAAAFTATFAWFAVSSFWKSRNRR